MDSYVGDVYISYENGVACYSPSTGQLNNVAGNLNDKVSADGTGDRATFKFPRFLTVDASAVYLFLWNLTITRSGNCTLEI